ncbi:FecR family protein [Terrimonas rubra]|uniref:FecR family protein n=1 Tax=Terrimonas rubra TaxID=1035890 RepID=A0ABW6A069_9BACT
MLLTPEQYKDLFERLLASDLSPADSEKIINWLSSREEDPLAAELILQQLAVTDTVTDEATTRALENRLSLILQTIDTAAPVKQIPFYKKTIWRAAAVFIVLVGMGFYLFNATQQTTAPDKPLAAVTSNAEIKPGAEGALLTLSDGSVLVLDSLGNGLVTMQNGTQVILKNGQLVYDPNNTDPATIGYNTMTTPKGRQFQLVLPDGSKVWLNAASSIHYPTLFTGDERLVEITGEAYFEVAHNAAKPFKVKVNNATTIEVLGTHFNVNAYSNEETINTTLLEGAVRVSGTNGKTVLAPGQQARTSGDGSSKVVNAVNTGKVIAWKNGVFDFEDASLEEVMRQLERWYDIEVVYEKNIPKLEFFGKMGKDLSLDIVLRGLEKSNVHFRVEANRKLVVLP